MRTLFPSRSLRTPEGQLWEGYYEIAFRHAVLHMPTVLGDSPIALDAQRAAYKAAQELSARGSGSTKRALATRIAWLRWRVQDCLSQGLPIPNTYSLRRESERLFGHMMSPRTIDPVVQFSLDESKMRSQVLSRVSGNP